MNNTPLSIPTILKEIREGIESFEKEEEKEREEKEERERAEEKKREEREKPCPYYGAVFEGVTIFFFF